MFSGHIKEGAPSTEGVGLILFLEAQGAVIGWEPVNSRIITAKFSTKSSKIKLNIMNCYAPTNDANDEKKDTLKQPLQTALDKAGKEPMMILMGDFNAKIGADNAGYNAVKGNQGLSHMNRNGKRYVLS